MILKQLTLAAAVAAAVLSTTLIAQGRPEVALRAAIEQEEAKGDIKGAIEQYRKLAENRDRAVAAQALLRLAKAYQRLGDVQARAVYERLVRQFEDQRAPFDEARRALGTPLRAAAATAKGDRPIWTGPDVDLFGTVSADGRYVSYVDWFGERNVRVLDLVTNASWAFTGNTAQNRISDGDFSAISRDGTRVAYWWNRTLWVAPLTRGGGSAAKAVSSAAYLRPFDWSPDGKFIAVLVNESQVGVLSVEDGSLRRLKSSDWQGINRIAFSPDGRFVAYDFATTDQRGRMDIRVIAVDASRDVAVVSDGRRNLLMGWSVDGTLVFSSDRSGSRSLWTLRVENGRAEGDPRLARENTRADISLGLTPAGTLYVYQAASPNYVRVLPFDESQGKVGNVPLFQQFIRERGRPSWSLDGRQLLFFSCDERNAPCTMFIRDGEAPAREVPHGMWYTFAAALAPDGRSVVAQGADLKDRGGAHRIDIATGETSRLDEPFGEFSPDGRWIRFVQVQNDETVLLERPVGGGSARELFRTRERDVRPMRISSDGKLVGYIQRQQTDAAPKYLFKVAPLDGGPARVIGDLNGFTQFWQWGSDNQSVFVLNHASDGSELWQLPLSANPRKLDVDARQWSAFQISPDGKKIAFAARAGKEGFEVWALENILPAGARR